MLDEGGHLVADLGQNVRTAQFKGFGGTGKVGLDRFFHGNGRFGLPDVPQHAIGIAPFAKHRGKIYPTDEMAQVVAHFAVTRGAAVFLFGAGDERLVLETWEQRFPNVQSMAGKLSLYDELALIQQLPVMITMDSANMHLASFVGTPVVSVWGATHPYAGFYGWQQPSHNAVQANIPCRPCSVFGNKPCYRGDYLCFREIAPAAIIAKAEKYLAGQQRTKKEKRRKKKKAR